MAKWTHDCAGVDHAAIAWRNGQAGQDKNPDPHSTAGRMKQQGSDSPTNQGVFVGSDLTVAALLDEMAEIPGLRGVTLTFDDVVIGMEQFGTRIQPLMKSRGHVMAKAA